MAVVTEVVVVVVVVVVVGGWGYVYVSKEQGQVFAWRQWVLLAIPCSFGGGGGGGGGGGSSESGDGGGGGGDGDEGCVCVRGTSAEACPTVYGTVVWGLFVFWCWPALWGGGGDSG